MSIQELQKYTKVSKYARYLKDKKRREVWPETVERYRSMMADKFPHRLDAVNEAAVAVEADEVMPSMRGLQFGGQPVEQHNARLYNCTSSYCDRQSFFGEAFYLLLCGCGTGASLQQKHVACLPPFSPKRLSGARLPKKVFRPEDNIEGWADCAHALVSSWLAEPVLGFEEWQDCEVEFDLSRIREKGSELSFGIGRAPGPEPLRKAMRRSSMLLHRARHEGLTALSPLYAYDLFMHLADAVISGGVRRAACIVLFSLADRLMLGAKTGDWTKANPQRARSNNSVLLLRNVVTYEQFREIFESTKQFGEPGFFWADDEDALCNPCVEVGFLAKLLLALNDPDLPRLLAKYRGPVVKTATEVQLSGWQMCNLSNVACKTIADKRDYLRRCRIAARLGTWQAAFTDFPYLGEVTERIVRREALIGVGMCGVMHKPELLLDPAVLREGAAAVVAANAEEAALVGINPAARNTVVKPDGNSAAANGSFSGASGGKFKTGFRIVAGNTLEAPFAHFKAANPDACEKYKWSANEADECARFCVEYDGLLEEDMGAVEYLEHIRTIQENWVTPGKRPELCTRPWLTNNVSNTVRVRDHEWDAVCWQIYRHRDKYAGVSLLSVYGDRDYAQAPFTAVFTTEQQVAAYGKQAVAIADRVLDVLSVTKFPDLWAACDAVLFDKDMGGTKESAWCGVVKLFAANEFAGDVRRATYCLKDAWNWRKWKQLRAAYRPVDYSAMVEHDNGVNLQAEVACGAGGCEM